MISNAGNNWAALLANWHITRNDTRYYYVKDHLGSIRQTWKENGTIVNGQDYYPFGEVLRQYTVSNPIEKYMFTEKERDKETGYDYFGARYYWSEAEILDVFYRDDPQIGRWLSVDPLAWKYPSLSPYNYTSNNPIKYVDYDGRDFGVLSVPAAIIIGEIIFSVAVTAWTVNTVTDGALWQEVQPVQMAKTDPSIVIGAQEGKKDLTQKNPAQEKKANQNYKKSQKQEPNNNNNGNNNSNNFKKGVKYGAAATATVNLLDHARQIIEQKRKDAEKAKKAKEQKPPKEEKKKNETKIEEDKPWN